MGVRFWLTALTVLISPALCPAADTKPKNDPSATVYGLDKVWSMHLTLTAEQWEKMQPPLRRGGFGFPGGPPPGQAPQPGQQPRPAPPPPPLQADAKPRGMFGMSFPYVKGEVEIDGHKFKDVGVRYKGNSSFGATQGKLKRPLKIDLARYNPNQNFHGEKKLTLNTNVMDSSAARETLSYAVYRALGVPAPRTAYLRLTLTVPGKYDKEFVGLYTLIESIDKTFLKNRFGSSKGLLLKPERVGPLEYLGEEWDAYDNRYRPKTPADSKSKRRLIAFTKLVQKADDETFRRDIDKYLDVDEFLRFLAATVSVVSMDSFIGLTHNYLLYLDPKTNKFVFLPWDFDHSFGGFPMMGSTDELAELSIRQPYTNNNRLIQRLLADEKVFAVYKGHLRKLLDKGFTVEGVRKDFAAINAAIEPIEKQEKEAVAARHEDGGRGGFGGMFRGTVDPPTFTAKRVPSLKDQLDGKSKGKVLAGRFGGPGGFGPGRFLARPVLEAADTDKDGKLSQNEMNAALKSLFAKLDKDHKGELTQEMLTEGINNLLPRPPGFGGPGRPPGAGGPGAAAAPPPGRPAAPPPPAPGGPGGRPGFGPPGGLGGMFAQTLVKEAGKDGKVNADRLLAAAAKRFIEADKNKDGKLDDKELPEALNKLMPPFGPPGGPGAPARGAEAAPLARPKEPQREGK
jgi:spore coat protein H